MDFCDRPRKATTIFLMGLGLPHYEDAVRMHNEEHSLQLDPNQRVLYFLKNGLNG